MMPFAGYSAALRIERQQREASRFERCGDEHEVGIRRIGNQDLCAVETPATSSSLPA